MDSSIIEAKARRNELDKLAGDSFRNGDSEIVKLLNDEGKEAYLGIQKGSGIYTIIGRHQTYTLSDSGIRKEVSHAEFLDVLRKNGMDQGKGGDFEFVPLSETESAWVKDGPTMCALWNIILGISRADKIQKQNLK